MERLAEALTLYPSDIPAALAHYETEQMRFGRQLVARGRYLDSYFEAEKKASDDAASSIRWDPQTVMMEQGRW